MTRSGVTTRATAVAGFAPLSAAMYCGGLEGLPALADAVRVARARRRTAVAATCRWVSTSCWSRCSPSTSPAGCARCSAGLVVAKANLFLPLHRQLRAPKVPYANILLIASTNRADALDPALMRPGRFDQRLTFELPTKRSRRELIDHFLDRKAHDAELDDAERRDALAADHAGVQPGHARAPARRRAHPGAARRAVASMSLGGRRGGPAGRSRSGSASRSRTPTTRSGSSRRTRPATRPWPGWSRRSAASRCSPSSSVGRPLGSAGPRRPRGRLHPVRAARCSALIQIAYGRPGRRGAVLRRHLDRPRRRPALRHQRRGADGRRGRHDRHPDLVRRGAELVADRHEPRRPGARRPGGQDAGREPAAAAEDQCARRCSRRTGTWSRRCGTRCSSGTSWSGREITDVLEAASDRGRTIDLREGLRTARRVPAASAAPRSRR